MQFDARGPVGLRHADVAQGLGDRGVAARTQVHVDAVLADAQLEAAFDRKAAIAFVTHGARDAAIGTRGEVGEDVGEARIRRADDARTAPARAAGDAVQHRIAQRRAIDHATDGAEQVQVATDEIRDPVTKEESTRVYGDE